LSARNRELLGLIPVAGLLIAGFAAVFVVRKDEVADASLIFGAYFFAICLAAHIFLRIRLPNADPYLFPLVALLAAIGLVMLYRIRPTGSSSGSSSSSSRSSSSATTTSSSATAI
jgi:hypothetical protein